MSNMMVVMFFIMSPAGEQTLRRFKISWIVESMLLPPISEGSGVKEGKERERERECKSITVYVDVIGIPLVQQRYGFLSTPGFNYKHTASTSPKNEPAAVTMDIVKFVSTNKASLLCISTQILKVCLRTYHA